MWKGEGNITILMLFAWKRNLTLKSLHFFCYSINLSKYYEYSKFLKKTMGCDIFFSQSQNGKIYKNIH